MQVTNNPNGHARLRRQLTRAWESRSTRAVMVLLLLSAATMPQAHAGIFETLGPQLAQPICEFLDSAMVTIIAGCAFILAAIGGILMKDKGVIGAILGVAALALFIMAVPSFAMQIGLNPLGC